VYILYAITDTEQFRPTMHAVFSSGILKEANHKSQKFI